MGKALRHMLAGLVVGWATLAAAAEPPTAKPAWQRLLQGEDAKKATELAKQLGQFLEAGKLAEALRVAEELAALRQRGQGADHWQAVSAKQDVEVIRRVMRQEPKAQAEYAGSFSVQRQAEELEQKGRYQEAQPLREKLLASYRRLLGEDHPDTATAYLRLADNLFPQGKYPRAADTFRKALVIYRTALGEAHPDTATAHNSLGASLIMQGKNAEAEESLQAALAIRRKVLGEEDPDTAASYLSLAYNQTSQGKYAEAFDGYQKALAINRKKLGEEHPDTARIYDLLGRNLNTQGKFVEAEEYYQKALAIRRKVLGEEHPDTATSYNNRANNLELLGKYQEAEQGYRTALAIYRKALGEEHPDTAAAYNNVALNLTIQGKAQQAEENYRKALAIWRKVLGEEHPSIAIGYNNVADNLRAQGRYQEAEEGYRRALAIHRKSQGEEHTDTARAYNNLASNLHSQGKYLPAEEGYRKALAIWQKVLGAENPYTATGHNNVADILHAQGKYSEADEGYRRALDIRVKILGEEHPNTAQSYHNLAFNQHAQGKYLEAEQGLLRALAVCRKIFGEEHPQTAVACNSLALNRNALGRFAAAEEGFRQALAIRQKVLGEDHPHTAVSYHNLASAQYAQGKYQQAEESWTLAATRFAKARPRLASSGLERSTLTSEWSPLLHLAAVLARQGKGDEAWRRFEESLGRGTWDDLSARLRRSLPEQAKQAQLVATLDRLDQLVEKIVAAKTITPAQEQHRKELLTKRRQTQDELDAFVRQMERCYGPASGQVFDRGQIQAALPDDVALVGWLDVPPAGPEAADGNGDHWAVLLRGSGVPVWVRLHGRGPQNSWTDADTKVPANLGTALREARGDWQRLAQQLKQQRLEALAKHLGPGAGLPAVRHLIVLPSTLLAGVPVEVFADGYTVSYALSGTLYAHLRQQPRPTSEGLLALADPIFELPPATEPAPPLPKGGILVTMVVPGSNAAQARLRSDDVLLRYNGIDLNSPSDLKVLPEAHDAKKTIPVTVWRAGTTFTSEVRPGKLGVVLAKEPAPQALAEQRRLEQQLTASRSEKWAPLPGTRAEVEAIRRLFPSEPAPRVLLGSQASEQELYESAKKDLGSYRYLHLATHGEVDNRVPLRSALVLARDHLPDPGKQLDAGLPIFDGKLTADKILRQWHLHCELVTLSACQTALGKYEKGEGFVGFAHALILSGSRSVCLSLWPVDDTATTLLMERFYENLLGRRDGLKAPLPKAKALAEAKAWLRSLSADEVAKRAAHWRQGIVRAKNRPVQPLLPEKPSPSGTAKDDRPYAHPYYWAAFVLIGDLE